MCQICVDAVKEFFPHFNDKQMSDLLWNCTAFPFADGGQIRQQIKELAEKSGGDMNECMRIADEEVFSATDEEEG